MRPSSTICCRLLWCIILASSCSQRHRPVSSCHRPVSSCHHPVIILLRQHFLSSSIVFYQTAIGSHHLAIILSSSCSASTPCHHLSSCIILPCPLLLLSPLFPLLYFLSSIRSDLHWFVMFLIESHTLSLHFMFFNTVIDFHCVFIDLMICWPVSISFFIFLYDFHCDWIISVHIVSQLVWLTCVVASFFFFSWSSWHHPASAVTGVEEISGRGHHPGIILPLQWADTIILASSWQSEFKKSKNSEVQALKPRQLHHPARLGWSS